VGENLPFCALRFLFDAGLDGRGFESQQKLGIFLFTTASRPTPVPTHPTIQWVPGTLSLEDKPTGVVKLTTNLHLVPRSRMRGDITPLPQYASIAWCSVKLLGACSFRGSLSAVRGSWVKRKVDDLSHSNGNLSSGGDLCGHDTQQIHDTVRW
jgi:hypothetical protein